jgi:hypothetical protein
VWGRWLFPHKKSPGSEQLGYSVLSRVERIISKSKKYQETDHAFIIPMVGAWYRPGQDEDWFESDLKKLSPWWSALKKDISGWEESDRRRLILREPLPQHFPPFDTGIYNPNNLSQVTDIGPCVPIQSYDFRQSALKKMMFTFVEGSVDILAVHENMRDLWFAHPEHGQANDCTHYCLAAAYWWNAELINMMQDFSLSSMTASQAASLTRLRRAVRATL